MSRRVSKEVEGRIAEVMFKDFGDSKAENFLRNELKRYIPQFAGWNDKDIAEFMAYQRRIWLLGEVPELGRPIASLNPTFVDSVDTIKVNIKGLYTRASVKENGYRLQLHNSKKVGAFSRQFVPYDLRMFPELVSTFERLPLMIGDTELVNKRYQHLAGFNRIRKRIPDQRFWPRRDSSTIDEDVLEEYFRNPLLFNDRVPTKEFEVMLAFHGMFAIAHPDTWCKQKEEQELISLCSLPMRYPDVDNILDRLAEYIDEKNIDARVVERKVVRSKAELRGYVKEKKEQDLEGVVVVQFDDTFDFAKGIKIKKYETIDTVLLGIYLHDRSAGSSEENLMGALLGLYDEQHNCYLAVCKVNLDPKGIQIKTQGQRERLESLNKELADILKDKKQDPDSLVTLYDVYIMEAKTRLASSLEVDPERVSGLFDEMPRGKNFLSMIEVYETEKKKYNSGKPKKSSSKRDKWIYKYKDILSSILELEEKKRKELMDYFSEASKIKSTSKKLAKPQFILDTTEPIIIEAQVFDIKYGLNPRPAGFHSWYRDSFYFTNSFAERIRHDKATTTDYATIHSLADKYTVKK